MLFRSKHPASRVQPDEKALAVRACKLPGILLYKTPTYFVPTSQFEELADHLKSRIDQTILGKRQRSRTSYSSFDEFQFELNAANKSA